MVSISPNATDYINDPKLELNWVMKVGENSEVHMNILCAVDDPKWLHLDPNDDIIYTKFREIFPDLRVACLTEEDIKSDDAKPIWREFCNLFSDKVADFNFGTLLRLDSFLDYSEENSTIVPRIQFLAIESARNREGCNQNLKSKYGKLVENRSPSPNS